MNYRIRLMLKNEFATERTTIYDKDQMGDATVDTVRVFKWPQAVQHYSYGHLSVINTYNPIYRMYNPIEITTYNWFLWP